MTDYVSELAQVREERDRFLREHYASPLPAEDQAAFPGLDYFPTDEAWRITASFDPSPPSKIDIPSTSGMNSGYTAVGTVKLTIADVSYDLIVLDDGDGGVFIPFRDGTSGTETYTGGRYVNLALDEHGDATIDFNSAANPWCVYDEEFVCPLPPQGNWIAERIEAGEKMYRSP